MFGYMTELDKVAVDESETMEFEVGRRRFTADWPTDRLEMQGMVDPYLTEPAMVHTKKH